MTILSIPLKRCSRGAKCVDPNGPFLPANSDYFNLNVSQPDGYASQCRACRRADYHQNKPAPKSWTLLIRKQTALRLQGLKFCVHCAQTKPLTAEYFGVDRYKPDGFSNYCKDCVHSANKRLRDAHPERFRARRKRMADYFRRYHQDWVKKHPDRRREIEQRYQRLHPAKFVAKSAARRARKLGNGGLFTTADWERALVYWDYRCAVCGRMADENIRLAQDHWLPLAAGGPHSPLNIVPLCHAFRRVDGVISCNLSKSHAAPYTWLANKFGTQVASDVLAKIDAYFEWVQSDGHDTSCPSVEDATVSLSGTG